MTSRSVTFTAPAKAITENQRLHWADRARLVRAWREATAWYALSAYGRLDPMGPCTVHIAIPVRYRRRSDPFNWAPTVKACVDGIVDAGWLIDDSAEYVSVLEPTLVVGGNLVCITATERNRSAA